VSSSAFNCSSVRPWWLALVEMCTTSRAFLCMWGSDTVFVRVIIHISRGRNNVSSSNTQWDGCCLAESRRCETPNPHHQPTVLSLTTIESGFPTYASFADNVWAVTSLTTLVIVRRPSSDFRLPTSDFRLPTSDFRLPTSDFRLPTSDFRLRSVVALLAFAFKHQLNRDPPPPTTSNFVRVG